MADIARRGFDRFADALSSAREEGRGDSARRPIPMTPEDLVEANMLIYLDGLKLGV